MSLMDELYKVANDGATEDQRQVEENHVLNGYVADELNGPIEEGRDAEGEDNNNGFSHNPAGENKTAYSLMGEFEKVAEVYPEEGRINRGLAAETFLGAGPQAYFAKKHNIIANEDDSHLVANAKINAAAGALGSGAYGAGFGGMFGGARGAAAGAALGGAVGAASGAVGGVASGLLHDRYDQHLRNKQQKQMEQVASTRLTADLEKIAAGWIGGIRNTVNDAVGKGGYNAANKEYKNAKAVSDRLNTPEGFANNARIVGVDNGGVAKTRRQLETVEGDVAKAKATRDAAKAQRDEARGRLAPVAVGAGVAGGAAAGATAGSAATNSKNNREKTASEEFMNELYKEAATQILDMHTPEVKAYEDPINRISFKR